MKKISFLIIMIAMMLCINVNATSSKFEGTLNIDEEFYNNQITVLLGTEGEAVNDIKLTIAYRNEYLTFDSITPLNGYIIENQETGNGSEWNIIDIHVTNEEIYMNDNFAVLTLNVSDDLPLNNYTELFVYNYEAKGMEEKYTYTYPGLLTNVRIVEDDKIEFYNKEITKSIKYQYWFMEHYQMFAVIGVVIFIVIILLLLIPGRRKENRSDNIKRNIEDNSNNPNIDKIKLN